MHSNIRSKSRLAVWNSPRQGGPLRWSKDLVLQINNQGDYGATLVTNPLSLLMGHVAPGADLIHAAVPVTARLWRKPYVLTVKGDYTIEKSFWKMLYPTAIKMADVVTVPSQYLIDRVPALAGATVIPNAVDLNQFTVSPGNETDTFQVLVVTNFWFPEKARGVSHLLKLIQQAAKESNQPELRVTVIGDGSFLEKIKSQARQLSFEVVFPGWSDPREYFPSTNLFLYYSFHDNMPNAVLEAMAAGLPIVTNQVGAISEMLTTGSDGLVSQNDDEYLEHLNMVLSDASLRARIGQAARHTIEQRFAWDAVIHDYLKIYRQLL